MSLPPPVVTTLPSIIPPADPLKPQPRTLVLCFDGTGDQFDADNSNVIQFFTLLQKDDHTQQMVYYQAGIGTYTIPQIATPLWAKLEQTVDTAIAWNLHAHVMQGYEFLMQNYQGGDKICIFGFSRGAYTARSLAGMIHKVGLLPTCNAQQVPFAYKMFTRTDETGWKQSVAFKKAFSIDVDIEFVGVWDTVCSVGLVPRRLPFVSSNTAIHYFRHAVSLDERRAKFKANLYNRPNKYEAQLGVQPGEMPKPQAQTAIAATKTSVAAKMREMYDSWNATMKRRREERAEEDGSLSSDDEDLHDWQHDRQDYAAAAAAGGAVQETDVLEVWFAGCHCDVGGGSVPNDSRHNLARIPLRWMIRQCFLAGTGIRFHTELLRNVGLDPATLFPVVQPRPAPLQPADIVSDEAYAAAMAAYTASLSGALATAAAPPMHTRTDSGKTLVDEPFCDSKAPPPCAPAEAPRVTTMARLRDGAPGVLSEAEEDLADALCPLYDQLVLAPAWWLLEVVRLTQRTQAADNTWQSAPVANWGRGRDVPVPVGAGAGERVHVHQSVAVRMDARREVDWEHDRVVERTYVPKARYRGRPFSDEAVRKEIDWVL